MFYIQESGGEAGSVAKGFGFKDNQQYAAITDFTYGEDQIRLPGAPKYYATSYYDSNDDGTSDSTAIFYTEDPNIDFSIGLGPISIGGTRTLEIPSEVTLVALVEESIDAQSLTDSTAYVYGAATI